MERLLFKPSNTVLKPKESMMIQIERVKGKPKNFKLEKYEYLDIDLKDGIFYVVNKFTGSRMLKYLREGESHTYSYVHQFDQTSLKRFKDRLEQDFTIIK